MRTLALIALIGCGGGGTPEPTDEVDSGTETDSGDSGEEAPTWPSHLCPNGVAVLSAGDAYEDGFASSDVVRWTGQVEAPTDLYAVAATAGQVLVISVTYDDTQLPFTQTQLPFIHFYDPDECGLNFGVGNAGGTTTTTTYSNRFSVPSDGTWQPLVGFPEVLPHFEELAYTLEVAVE